MDKPFNKTMWHFKGGVYTTVFVGAMMVGVMSFAVMMQKRDDERQL